MNKESKNGQTNFDPIICNKCGKKMKNVKDPITKKVSKYLWACKCRPHLILSIG